MKHTTIALIAVACAATLTALTGCITIPLPPAGENAGKHGWLHIGYTPSVLTTPYLTTPTTGGYSK